jgi:predicted metal-dependent hydrolase
MTIMNSAAVIIIDDFVFRYRLMCEHFDIAEADRPTLYIKHMKSRWGHYTVTRLWGRRISHSITLSTRLLDTSTACVDMVIAHELCHIRWRTHGVRFKAYITQMYPTWKVQRKELKEFQKAFPKKGS